MPSYYAQIDASGIVHTVMECPDRVVQENIIEIPDFDLNLLGKLCNSSTGAFEEIEQEKAQIDTMSPLEEVKEQLLTMNDKINQLQIDVSSIKQATEESAVKQL